MITRTFVIAFLLLFCSKDIYAQVNASSRQWDQVFTDFSMPNASQTNPLDRIYTEKHKNGILGNKWCTHLDISASISGQEAKIFRCQYTRVLTENSRGKFVHSPSGDKLSVSPDGIQFLSASENTNYFFDRAGHLKSIAYADKQTVTLDRDSQGSIKKIFLNGKPFALIKIDRGGRAVEILFAHGPSAKFTYVNGNLTQSKNSWGNTYSYEYNQKGQVQKIQYPDGTNYQFDYSTDGKITKVTDRHQCTETIATGIGSRKLKVSRLCPEKNGQSVQIETNVPLNISQSELNPKKIISQSEIETYSLDTNGRVKQMVRGKLVVNYFYDNKSFLYKLETEGKTYLLSHDSTGHLTSIVESSGNSLFVNFDSARNKITKMNSRGLASTSELSLFFKVLRMMPQNKFIRL